LTPFLPSARKFWSVIWSASTWEADTANEVLKAGVQAERIKARPQQDSGVKALLVAFFEPIHRLIAIAESCIDHGKLRGMRITKVRALLQIAQ
jgi:hypothetical protein